MGRRASKSFLEGRGCENENGVMRFCITPCDVIAVSVERGLLGNGDVVFDAANAGFEPQQQFGHAALFVIGCGPGDSGDAVFDRGRIAIDDPLGRGRLDVLTGANFAGSNHCGGDVNGTAEAGTNRRLGLRTAVAAKEVTEITEAAEPTHATAEATEAAHPSRAG